MQRTIKCGEPGVKKRFARQRSTEVNLKIERGAEARFVTGIIERAEKDFVFATYFEIAENTKKNDFQC